MAMLMLELYEDLRLYFIYLQIENHNICSKMCIIFRKNLKALK
jgi:hypothetical protein